MSMMTFEYQVRDRGGQIIKGKIDAPSQAAVVTKLRGMGYAPVSIKQTNAGMRKEINLSFGNKVKLKDLSVMARQMATMINSGLPLLRALAILEEQTPNQTLSKTLAEVRIDVEGGQSLSSALGKRPLIFPPLFVSMVRAGETGGFLDEVLLQLADNFEKEVKLRSKIKSAMAYPVIILIVAVLSLIAMLLFIVPVFAGLYDSLGGTLPAPTRILVTMAAILKVSGPILIVALVVFSIWWGRNRHKPKVRAVVDPLKLKAPIFGNLNRKLALSRLTRNFGMMVRSGVPILQALDIVSDTSGNVVMSRAVRDIQESVRQGETMSKPLTRHPIFPPMVVQMISVGEDTGALDTMLVKIADFYDNEVEATTDALTSIIEPIMIVVVGGMIGSMIIALYLPIFNIYELIKK